MTLGQKIECRILDLYGEYKEPEDAFNEMMDHIMNEISKDVYGKPLSTTSPRSVTRR